MKAYQVTVELFLIQSNSQFHLELHIGGVVQSLSCSEMIDPESNHKPILCGVELIRGCVVVLHVGQTDNRVVMFKHFYETLEREGEKDGDK